MKNLFLFLSLFFFLSSNVSAESNLEQEVENLKTELETLKSTVRILEDKVNAKESSNNELGKRRQSAKTTFKKSDNFIITKKRLDSAIEQSSKTLVESRSVPYFKNGSMYGIRLFAIKRNSLVSDLGFKNGDIIKELDDRPVEQNAFIIKFLKSLQKHKKSKLLIQRHGRDVVFNYSTN